jgi:hypothetical protein
MSAVTLEAPLATLSKLGVADRATSIVCGVETLVEAKR